MELEDSLPFDIMHSVQFHLIKFFIHDTNKCTLYIYKYRYMLTARIWYYNMH
jgi:hypothetical protein